MILEHLAVTTAIFLFAVLIQVVVTYLMILSDYPQCFQENEAAGSEVCLQVLSSIPVKLMRSMV